MKFKTFSINRRGSLMEFTRPQVMGIINVTHDSFYGASRVADVRAVAGRAVELIAQGADILDIGACSTRPGSEPVDSTVEASRLVEAVEAIRRELPDIPLSVDTYRADVARLAIEAGADIVNDISGGQFDQKMFSTVAQLKVPYILTHTRGLPLEMQSLTDYDDVVSRVVMELSPRVETLRLMGVCDIIVDPGLGFAKTLEQNYRLLESIDYIGQTLECPVLVGASRKSMITKALNITPDEALNGTTVVNTVALLGGAAILRVHDPREAAQAITLTSHIQ